MTIPLGTSLDAAASIADEARALQDASKMREVENYILANIPNDEARMHILDWIQANIEGIERGGDPTPMNLESVQKRLEERYGYSTKEAKLAAMWLLRVRSDAAAAIELWWEFNEVAALSAHGVALPDLVARFGYTTPAAIVILDSLYRIGPDIEIGPVDLTGDPFKVAASKE